MKIYYRFLFHYFCRLFTNLYYSSGSIPAFEGLLPDKHNVILMDLLFILAHWHALAKLRQHTELTLKVLESVTTQLGKSLKIFEAYNMFSL